MLPERQGRGIGSALIREGLARAEAGGWRGVFGLGEPAYYRRFGFDAEAARGFASPYAGPFLMVLPLGGALPATGGTIRARLGLRPDGRVAHAALAASSNRIAWRSARRTGSGS